jgi:outer membrane autotransporter protein
MTAGQAANIGLLSLTWLPDHSYESADMALRLSEKAWAPFGGLDYAMVQSGRDTKIRTDSARIMAGVAWQRPADSSDFLASLFIEGIKGRYHLDADYGTIFADHPHIKAKGDIDAVDIGLMIRQKWHNGLRLEASGRYGVSRNEFNSSDFTNSLGHTMNYKTRTPFWSVHAGVGYEHKLSERSTLDLVARYYFTRLDSDRVTLDSGEQVSFKAVDSSRVRAGGRFSMRHTERITWYAGAYYEHELKGKSVGEHLGIQFEADELKGGTGIGELGVSFRSTPDHPWNVEAGIQIYAGRNRGYSGGVRFGYEF